MIKIENETQDLAEEELEGIEEKEEEKQVDENESISAKRLRNLMKVVSPMSFLLQTVGVIIFGWIIGSWMIAGGSLFWGRFLFLLLLLAGMVRYVHLMTKEPPGRGP